MISYKNGFWGLSYIWSLRPSPFPRAFALAFPNAVITFFLSRTFQPNPEPEQEKLAFSLWAGFTSVLGFLLYFRGQKAYSRWWEGGTLLQQVRGEWFNAYSSLIAFCSPDAAKQDAVDEFQHLLGRLMSLLFCAALQQVSPQQRSRSFEIIETRGIDHRSLNFLATSPDAVEVIIQWIQRSTVLNMGSGVLHVPPPVLSRVFQELSRGIVNLQNARKIAEFPFPFPFAQTSVVMLIIHWIMSPIITGLMLEKYVAACTSFTLIFFFWCINYISLQLEMPYGEQPNDLPLDQMQADWNRSLSTLLHKAAQCPPQFVFDRDHHSHLWMSNSDHTFQTALHAVQEEGMDRTFSQDSKKSVKSVKSGRCASPNTKAAEASVSASLSLRRLQVKAPMEVQSQGSAQAQAQAHAQALQGQGSVVQVQSQCSVSKLDSRVASEGPGPPSGGFGGSGQGPGPPGQALALGQGSMIDPDPDRDRERPTKDVQERESSREAALGPIASLSKSCQCLQPPLKAKAGTTGGPLAMGHAHSWTPWTWRSQSHPSHSSASQPQSMASSSSQAQAQAAQAAQQSPASASASQSQAQTGLGTGAGPSGPGPGVGAVVIGACGGACGGAITVNGLEREGQTSLRPLGGRGCETERRPASAGPHRSLNGHPPPWTLDVGLGPAGGTARSSVQCDTGCLQALVRMRPAVTGRL